MGNTEFSQDEILSLVRDLADKYRGNRYHLLSREAKWDMQNRSLPKYMLERQRFRGEKG